MKGIKAGFAAILSFFLVWGLCACGSQDASSSNYRVVAPLKEPQYVEALSMGFEYADPIHNWSDFVFKGSIDKVSEIEITWPQADKYAASKTAYYWLTSCDVTIENILYGEAPVVNDKIKVVFLQSSRSLIRGSMELKEGMEYYFLTHFFTEKEKSINNDMLKFYRFGDVEGGTRWMLMPVKDGMVTFNGDWPFTGSKQVRTTEESIDSYGGITATIDENSFLEQFILMLKAAKGTFVPIETTFTPTEPDITTMEPIATFEEPTTTPTEPIVTQTEPTATPIEPTLTPVEPTDLPEAT